MQREWISSGLISARVRVDNRDVVWNHNNSELMENFQRPVMFNERFFTLTVALMCLPMVANAQSGAAPVYRERELAQIIREAGYDCSQVESITNAPAPPPGWESLRPEIATCQNGKRFLVTKSGRSGGNLRPVVRPMPGGA